MAKTRELLADTARGGSFRETAGPFPVGRTSKVLRMTVTVVVGGEEEVVETTGKKLIGKAVKKG